jgi:7,8-dihydropterin-6-yl-methyl-4-(beta-D-ribofuranosyl)aminobenzene 5'-phosphate synthase
MALRQASKLEIVSLMDNTIDFLSSQTRKEVQPLWYWNSRQGEMPFAEHGFSMLIKVYGVDSVCTVLFDAGVSPDGVVSNAKRMGVDLGEVQFVVLSHGHYDHFGGLVEVVKSINREDLVIITHEDMFRRHGTQSAKGEIREYSAFPETSQLKPAKIVNTKQPNLIADDLAFVTGEIPRTVEFETGLIHNRILRDNTWQPDPNFLDERALVFNVEGKGLVVISGCAHTGIINTLRYAQKITGENRVYAVLGGFHLAGREFEKRIEPTITELKKVNPKLVVASHCTGWRALCAMNKEFPEAYVANAVGNRYTL